MQQRQPLHHDSAQLQALAQRIDAGETSGGGGWSSVCNTSLLQPCDRPPRSTLSLCPWCMRLVSAAIRSSLPPSAITLTPFALFRRLLRTLRRSRASPGDSTGRGPATSADGMPLPAAVLSARLLYGAGLSCLCARVLHDADQRGRHAELNAVASSLIVRCRCDSPSSIISAAAATNATLSTGMPSLHMLRNYRPSPSALLPALTLFDSMSWQVRIAVADAADDHRDDYYLTSWQHFDTAATLACPPPSACLWFRTLDILLPQIIIVDCLETGRGVPPRGRGQIIVFLCLESSAHLPHTRTPAFLQRFDITATYHRALPPSPPLHRPPAHLWLTYAPPSPSHLLHPPISPSLKRRAALWVVSNCAPARVNLVQQLQRYIPVDVFGKCSGRPLPVAQSDAVYGSNKTALMQEYWLSIAFENAIDVDYVTEKLYQPLIAGSIPVYFGAPNAREYLPDASAAVLGDSFATVDEMGAYLRDLLSSDDELQQRVAWKSKGSKNWSKTLMQAVSHAFNAGTVYSEVDMRQQPCSICAAANNLLLGT